MTQKQPIFKDVFKTDWPDLPPVMHQHYANRPYSDDRVTVTGHLDVMCAGPLKLLSPLLWWLRGIPPHNEKNVLTTVHFDSRPDSKALHFNRIFHFKTRKAYSFQSRMLPTSNNEVIEIMPFGLGWRTQFSWRDNKVILEHRGYVLQIGGRFIPLPLTLLLGKGYAEETAIDDKTFAMITHITHPWWGKVYEYKGRFEITRKQLD
ncbi:MAG: DUF4166 domain-containing protein [Pseudomonadota bacterium]